jgi:hypothetical protein
MSMTFPFLNIFGFKPPFAPNDFRTTMENYFGDSIDKVRSIDIIYNT